MKKNKVHCCTSDDYNTWKMPGLSITCRTLFKEIYGHFDYDYGKYAFFNAIVYGSFHLDRDYDFIS